MQQYAIQQVSGQRVQVPVAEDGTIDEDALRQSANIPSDRALVLQRSDGTNLLVNPGQRLRVSPGDRFFDAPRHTRGGY